MNASSFYRRWFDHFAGVVDAGELEVISAGELDGREGTWLACPCGDETHYAWRPLEDFGLSLSPADVVTGFVCGRQWLVRTDVAGMIRKEEESYISLLRRAPKIVRKVLMKMGETEEAFSFLHDTHGIDRETVESCLADAKKEADRGTE